MPLKKILILFFIILFNYNYSFSNSQTKAESFPNVKVSSINKIKDKGKTVTSLDKINVEQGNIKKLDKEEIQLIELEKFEKIKTFLIIIVILSIVSGFFIYLSLNTRNKDNKILREKNKLLEDALNEASNSKAKLKAIFDNSIVGIIIGDCNGKFTFINKALADMLGYSIKEIYDLCMDDLTYKDDIEVSNLKMKQLISGEINGFNIEKRYVRKDGSIFWCETSISPILQEANKKFNYTIGIIIDITERKRVEERLKFLSSITQKISDSIIVAGTDFKIIYANKAAEELFGYSQAELIGKYPDILNAEPQADLIERNICETVTSGNIWLGKHLNKRKDGSTFICEFKVSPLFDDYGEITNYIATHRDVTQHIKIENALKESEEKYRTVVEQSQDYIYIYWGDRILFANQKIIKDSGYTEEEIYQMNVWDIFHPEDRERIKELSRKRQLLENVTNNYKAHVLNKKGEMKYLNFNVSVINYKGQKAIVGTAKEITELG